MAEYLDKGGYMDGYIFTFLKHINDLDITVQEFEDSFEPAKRKMCGKDIRKKMFNEPLDNYRDLVMAAFDNKKRRITPQERTLAISYLRDDSYNSIYSAHNYINYVKGLKIENSNRLKLMIRARNLIERAHQDQKYIAQISLPKTTIPVCIRKDLRKLMKKWYLEMESPIQEKEEKSEKNKK